MADMIAFAVTMVGTVVVAVVDDWRNRRRNAR